MTALEVLDDTFPDDPERSLQAYVRGLEDRLRFD